MPPPATQPRVTVRYWAAARAAAGVDSEGTTGATVGAVIEAVATAHPGLEVIVKVASFLVDGRVARREDSVREGAVVEILPPFAGG